VFGVIRVLFPFWLCSWWLLMTIRIMCVWRHTYISRTFDVIDQKNNLFVGSRMLEVAPHGPLRRAFVTTYGLLC